MKPIKDNILIEKEDAGSKTDSGLYISGKRETNIGKVTAIGNDVKEVKVGDRVYYENPTEIGDHTFVTEDNILAVL